MIFVPPPKGQRKDLKISPQTILQQTVSMAEKKELLWNNKMHRLVVKGKGRAGIEATSVKYCLFGFNKIVFFQLSCMLL